MNDIITLEKLQALIDRIDIADDKLVLAALYDLKHRMLNPFSCARCNTAVNSDPITMTNGELVEAIEKTHEKCRHIGSATTYFPIWTGHLSKLLGEQARRAVERGSDGSTP